MSYFTTALRLQAERRHLNQSDLARLAGLSRSFMSRVLSGEASVLSEDNHNRLLQIFSNDPVAQAEIIAGRCADVREAAKAAGQGAGLVDIRVRHTRPAESKASEPEPVALAQETERAFAWLRAQCPLNPELEKHLVGYAKLTGMK